MKSHLLLTLALTLLFVFAPVKKAEASSLDDWVIRDFSSEIIVNQDSSLNITERIIADCGDLQGKHGIFRVLPYQTSGVNGEVYKTPLKLIGITDFEGRPYHYETSKRPNDKTITWKIGDPQKTVTGVNNYLINYRVDNAIRAGNDKFDELYWNLNGNFWKIPIESYRARIIFPSRLNLENSETHIYSGAYGNSSKDSAVESETWSGQELNVRTAGVLQPGEGLTLSVTLPKNYFVPYLPPFWERNAGYFYSLLPLIVLMACFLLWKRYGRDPKTIESKWSIAPEFDIPENLPALELGLVKSDGTMKNSYLTAAIIGLAVKKHLKIVETRASGPLRTAEFKLERVDSDHKQLSDSEKLLLDKIFDGSQSRHLSELKNNFYKNIPAIESKAVDYLSQKNWIIKSSKVWMGIFLAIGFVLLFASFMLFNYVSLAVSVLVSAVIILAFAPLMARRTVDGFILYRKIKGFELYIKKAEAYRQQWLEKQNIFEEFLPYAILFGVAKEWMRKLQNIYGAEYFAAYYPIWYYGRAGSFDFNQFTSSIDTISNKIGTTLSSNPSSSGAGGGGFSGGGGGGGGGGGW